MELVFISLRETYVYGLFDDLKMTTHQAENDCKFKIKKRPYRYNMIMLCHAMPFKSKLDSKYIKLRIMKFKNAALLKNLQPIEFNLLKHVDKILSTGTLNFCILFNSA